MARARFYQLDELRLAECEFSGQALLLVQTMLDKQPITTKQLTDIVKPRLQTRQDPLRVVAFYLSTWKKSGLVNVVDSPEPTQGAEPAEQPVAVPEPEFVDARDDEEYNFAKGPLQEAITAMLELDGESTPAELAEHLQLKGRTVTAKQVSDACRKLLAKGDVHRSDDGKYDLSEAVIPAE